MKPFYFPSAVPPFQTLFQSRTPLSPGPQPSAIWALCCTQNFSSPSTCTVANRATGVFCNIFPLLAQDSALTQSNKLTLYKLLTQSILTYTVPVWSSTCSSNYLRLPVSQSKCLQVIGNHPRLTPTFHIHYTLNIEPFPFVIH
jgi:hypothetical protein